MKDPLNPQVPRFPRLTEPIPAAPMVNRWWGILILSRWQIQCTCCFRPMAALLQDALGAAAAGAHAILECPSQMQGICPQPPRSTWRGGSIDRLTGAPHMRDKPSKLQFLHFIAQVVKVPRAHSIP